MIDYTGKALEVVNLLKALDAEDKKNIDEARKVIDLYNALSEEDKQLIKGDVHLFYKYFDAIELIKKADAEEEAKPVIELFTNLNSDDSDYREKAKKALDEFKKLSSAAIFVVILSDVRSKLEDAKALFEEANPDND
ncbi:hypothetical protein [Clostridium cylindrosporum]|uniref:Uncharacterized protein n=1 Tax=Clostridium cylindrosporum DSM 605 TaxID=1121307 RepID=A0A0J8DAL4_CLOCY|nr:hypothetical protein [Clostridium cylindrosporum]KMT22887.1 hypothetical protein CLCY_5c01260 [Clostridium cylindrosporum DSM 605]